MVRLIEKIAEFDRDSNCYDSTLSGIGMIVA